MNVLDVFLAEAPFPPKKPASAGGPPGRPTVAGKPTAAPAKEDAGDGGGSPPFGGNGDNSDALIAAQQAEEEREQQEAQARAAREAEEQAERDRIKEMRVAADEEVADDLDSKFNDQDDQVVWHPSVDAILYGGVNDDGKGRSFADHMDKKMGLKKEDEKDKPKSDETDDNEDPERLSKKKPKQNSRPSGDIVIKM